MRAGSSGNSKIPKTFRWARVLASSATGKTYPQLDTTKKVTIRYLVMPVGVTVDHKFNGTPGNITGASPHTRPAATCSPSPSAAAAPTPINGAGTAVPRAGPPILPSSSAAFPAWKVIQITGLIALPLTMEIAPKPAVSSLP
jgi:hypothetical protein